MERSKLPVLRASHVTDLTVPSAKKPCPPKPGFPLYSKNPNIAFSTAAPNGVVFKAGGSGKNRVVSKKAGPPVRGPINRYRVESELKDKNQLLEAANTSLHNSLNTIQEKSEQQQTLKEELKELQRRLEKNMIILESRNIDPVSGEHIISVAEETSRKKEETKAFTEHLVTELQIFALATKEQKELVQKLKTKWNEAEESRNQFLQEQEAFQSDLEQFGLSLEHTKQWLDL
ncbi:small kinetochore-associated protein isoform X2 [Bufo bufo]|uniref:small kinetochore-associated protein isoform X2 n=1 Tax=Bufo bufo TaxID=8384 RepID=UPI001ABDAF92|nr:small kinetochore-associated protein isoform X2 [Bufo bufo]